MIAITNVTLSCLVLVFIEFGFQNLNRTHFCPCRNNHIIRRFSRLKKFEITYSRITAHRRTVQKKSRILHCRERQHATEIDTASFLQRTKYSIKCRKDCTPCDCRISDYEVFKQKNSIDHRHNNSRLISTIRIEFNRFRLQYSRGVMLQFTMGFINTTRSIGGGH